MANCVLRTQLAPLLPLPEQLAAAQQQAAQVCTALLSCATGGTPVLAVVYGCILTSGVGVGMLSSKQSWVLRTQLAPAQQQVANLEAQVCTALTLCAPGAPHCPCCCVCLLISGTMPECCTGG